MPKNYAKRAYGRKGYKQLKRYTKVKQMVTGEGPTMVEKIASGIGGVATLAKAVLPAIAAINTEAKYHDETMSGNAYGVSTNSLVQCLTDSIARGTTDSDRIGNSVLAKDFYFRAQIYWLPTATLQVGVSRMILFVWKDNANANPPTVAKILENPDINSAINKDYSDQFVVLKDKIFVHNANTTSTVAQDMKNIKVYKKLNFHMRWLDNDSITQNHVYVLFLGGSATSANPSTINLYSRLNYTDN